MKDITCKLAPNYILVKLQAESFDSLKNTSKLQIQIQDDII